MNQDQLWYEGLSDEERAALECTHEPTSCTQVQHAVSAPSPIDDPSSYEQAEGLSFIDEALETMRDSGALMTTDNSWEDYLDDY